MAGYPSYPTPSYPRPMPVKRRVTPLPTSPPVRPSVPPSQWQRKILEDRLRRIGPRKVF
ncbi:MAG TPA: hypothetical protein ACFYD4_13590 [Candidatus Wunengus sp. YC61]|uniref:hypothetical protein n=1 Tax=Candidatus Wunengus sp. YC61 TaxID=3367698 RepID=UPI00402946BE